MSITLLKDKDNFLPIRDTGGIHIVFAGDSTLYESSPLKDYFSRSIGLDRIKDKIALFAIFTNVAAWKGSSGINMREQERIIGLIQHTKTSIVIAFGSPYILRHFKEADVLIAAYDGTEQAQRAVLKCLMGERPFKGRLPVSIYE